MRDLVVTSALPYANGSIHLGHLVEYLMTDIFVRFQKMREGRRVLYFCADDTHGAPIMIRARKEGITPEELVARYHAEHLADFTSFGIAFDNYHSTNSPENKDVSEEIYLSLKKNGNIVSRDIEQTYCPHDAMFLPDRFVRGVCPKCGADDQYGDSCDKCGAHYEPTALKEPRCSLCGTVPIKKSSRHLFFRVADYEETLRAYMETDALQPEVKNFMATWLKDGLKEWDISRDPPYFGFRIPEEEEEKYFYVWLDAPIGYLGSAKHWAEERGQTLDDLWRNDNVDIHHFIGKDITYFHTLFWIPTLTGSGYHVPAKIHVHGFLTVNGEKMSKSKGTFINARDYLKHLDPEYLRYYYATKIRNSVDDIDLSMDDFLHRVNAELVNKIANLGSRTIGMLNKLDNRLGFDGFSSGSREMDLLEMIKGEAPAIAADYETCDFSLALKKIARLADAANEYIDAAKPWDYKNEPERQRHILTTGINAFLLLTKYLKPAIPAFAQKVESILRIAPLEWNSFGDTPDFLHNHEIGAFERLANRIEQKSLDALIETAKKNGEAPAKVETKQEEKNPEIEFDDFAKVDLRTATVLSAIKVEKADKLLHLTIDVGGEERSLVAGVAQHYTAEEMVGKTIVIVANLKPRKLRGIVSQGMLLAVNDGATLRLVAPEQKMPSGIRVS